MPGYRLDVQGQRCIMAEACAELSARLPDPPLTLPPAVTGPVQGELQLHVSQLVLEEAGGAADDQEYQA